jgi:hypothetical protein
VECTAKDGVQKDKVKVGFFLAGSGVFICWIFVASLNSMLKFTDQVNIANGLKLLSANDYTV